MCKECGVKQYKSFEELPQELKDKFKNNAKGGLLGKAKDGYVDFINKLNKRGDKLVGNYINKRTKVSIKYNKCGHIPPRGVNIDNYKSGQGCPICSGHQLQQGINDVATTHPHLVKYFVNEEDAKKYSLGSKYKVQLKCPRCGKIKTDKISVNDLTLHGFSCEFCSDGVSYPEKVMALILYTLGIGYKRQCKFNGYDYKYDFYLINSDTIIEVHGGQHYKDGRGYMKTYEEEHENDLVKYDLAVLNGYEYNKNYFVIDARYSNIEHMGNSIRQCEIFKQFNLDNIDWQEIDTQTQDSLKIEICEYWKQYKEKNPSLTIFDLINILELKIGLTTIRSYLNWGNENGFCEYNGEEERLQAFHSRVDTFVYLIRPNGEKWFEEPMSQSELCRKTGIFHTTLGSSRRNNKPLKYSGHAKYDPKYIGSYVVLASEYDAQNN